jgi:hypothetical protein
MPITIARPAILRHFNTNINEGLGPAISTPNSAVISSAQSKFGGSSLYLPATYAGYTNDSTFNLGTGDFTIEMWSYRTAAVGGALMTLSYNGSYAGIVFCASTGLEYKMYMGSNGYDIASALAVGPIVTGVWEHWELGRSGTTFYIFRNGTLVTTITSSLPIYYNSGSTTAIGYQSGAAGFSGYIDELRIVKGTCLHTANFTPSTEEYAVDPNIPGIEISQTSTGSISNNASAYIIGTGAYGTLVDQVKPAILVNPFEQIASRLQSIRPGIQVIHLGVKTKVQTVRSGVAVLDGVRKVSKISPAKNAKLLTKMAYGQRAHGRSGTLLRTFQVDSSASNKFSVVVNATHQYKTQTITVTSSAVTDLTGKWSFSVGNDVVNSIDTDVMLDSITFSVDPATLVVGVNKCTLKYLYTSRSPEFITLYITKEAIKRELVERTFLNYDGGYTIEGDVSFRKMPMANGTYSDGLYTNTTCTVTTTDNTSIDLVRYSGIVGVDFTGDGCLFLFSFDKRSTWHAYDGTSWSVVDPANISTQGMPFGIVKALNMGSIANVFSGTQLDLKIYMDKTKSGMVDLARLYVSTSISSSIGSLNEGVTTYGSYTVPAGYGPYSIPWSQTVSNLNAGNGGESKLLITTKTTPEFAAVYNIARGATWTGTYMPPTGQQVTLIRVSSKCLATYGAASSAATINVYPYVAGISKILVTLPPNLPPTITGVSLTPSTLHSGNAILTATIADPDGDDVQYRVTVNGTTELTPWTSLAATPQGLSSVIPFDSGPVGTNAISIQASDGSKESTPFVTYLTRSNENPTVMGVLTGNILSADVGDLDGDPVRYKVQVNGVVTHDWTELATPPVHIDYTIPRHMINIGVPNEVVITAEDSNQGQGICTFDFVGQYCGLMFTDEDGAFYSDDQGNTLKYINLGTFLVGTNSAAKAVTMKNLTGMPMNNIIVSPDELSITPNTTIKLSKSGTAFEDLDSVTIPGTLAHGDTYTIYVKSYTSDNAVGDGNFKLKVKGDIA